MKLQGSYPAIITPFRSGKVDEPALRSLIRRLIRGGSSGLVACGTTGEAATLKDEEYRQVVSLALSEARGKGVPVIAGVSSNDTAKAAQAARAAQGLGANALLLLSPYYNKPGQEGLFRHFQAVAKAVRLPVIVYNIPGRTAVNVEPATLARLARACANVAGVKEASGSLDQVSAILKRCPRGFTVLSGDDSLTLPMLAVGARGVISVAANIVPAEMARLCSSFLEGDIRTARRLHQKLFPLIKALFIETNPIPLKAAARMLGLCSEEVRLPLTPMSPSKKPVLRAELARFGLL